MSVVYFVRARGDAPIKIGVTSDLPSRLSHIQVSNWRKIELLHYFPATGAMEKAIHRSFGADQLSGEWYAATPALLHFVSALQEGHALQDALAEAEDVRRLAASVAHVRHISRLIRKYRLTSKAQETLVGMREFAFRRVRALRTELRQSPAAARHIIAKRACASVRRAVG